MVQGIGQGHVPEAVMVTVGLAVGGDVDYLWPCALLGKASHEALGEGFSAF